MMDGIIDFAVSPVVRGWINVGDRALGKVQAWRGERLIAESSPNAHRPDLTHTGNCFGFELRIEGGYSISELAAREMRIVWNNGETRELQLWRPLSIAGLVERLSQAELKRMLLSLKELTLRDVRNALSIDGNISKGGMAKDEFEPRYGAVSEEKVAIVGGAGHYFLYKGNNNVVDTYRRSGASASTVEGWKGLVRERTHYCAARGIEFVQMFIPEKSTVISHLVPYGISGPSANWREIVSGLEGDPAVADMLVLMQQAASVESCFRKQDTHLSSYGAMEIARDLARRLTRVDARFKKRKYVLRQSLGDLGGKFFDKSSKHVEFAEYFEDVAVGGAMLSTPVLLNSFDPAEGHTGIKRVWQSNDAPFKQRVVCFGNSFFERGGSSACLSWWFARMFSEFHFIWSPNLIEKYIEETKPDVVICQTIERFLGRVPDK